MRHRDIGDLMRYCTLVQDISSRDRYGEPQPHHSENGHSERYGDEQLYALPELYLYSLRAPQSLNRYDATAARGEAVFQHAGCGFVPHAAFVYQQQTHSGRRLRPTRRTQATIRCNGNAHRHGPALCARNPQRHWLLQGSVTQGSLVPGSPSCHNGSVATLEDWFDPARLRDDYVPTGFKGYDGRARSVKGHPFGLDLSRRRNQKGLIRFLKTL